MTKAISVMAMMSVNPFWRHRLGPAETPKGKFNRFEDGVTLLCKYISPLKVISRFYSYKRSHALFVKQFLKLSILHNSKGLILYVNPPNRSCWVERAADAKQGLLYE
jgi:hypothetical protein